MNCWSGKLFIKKGVSDHSPLEAIWNKRFVRCTASFRIQRMRLPQYKLTIVYKPGKKLLIGDAFLCYVKDENSIWIHGMDSPITSLIGI